MQGQIQDCKSAFAVDENGNDIKISDRDEVNDLKNEVISLWKPFAVGNDYGILFRDIDEHTIELYGYINSSGKYFNFPKGYTPNGYCNCLDSSDSSSVGVDRGMLYVFWRGHAFVGINKL